MLSVAAKTAAHPAACLAAPSRPRACALRAIPPGRRGSAPVPRFTATRAVRPDVGCPDSETGMCDPRDHHETGCPDSETGVCEQKLHWTAKKEPSPVYDHSHPTGCPDSETGVCGPRADSHNTGFPDSETGMADPIHRGEGFVFQTADEVIGGANKINQGEGFVFQEAEEEDPRVHKGKGFTFVEEEEGLHIGKGFTFKDQ